MRLVVGHGNYFLQNDVQLSCPYFLEDFKRNAVMNISTMNITRVIKNLINNSIKNITFKIHGHGCFVLKKITYNQWKKKVKERKKAKKEKKTDCNLTFF